jgi:hypothetical protein
VVDDSAEPFLCGAATFERAPELEADRRHQVQRVQP